MTNNRKGDDKNVKDKEKCIPSTPIFPPAMSDIERDSQLASLAKDLVEARMRNGTATSSEVVACLKLASKEQSLKIEQQEVELELLRARIDDLKRTATSNELYSDAIRMFKVYAGQGYDEDDEEEDPYDQNIY